MGKYEESPTESLLSAPGEIYTSLFHTQHPLQAADPNAVMTPPSIECDSKQDIALYTPDASALADDDMASMPGTPDDRFSSPFEGDAGDADKKPTKKRKSWGQVLPEPKTNLPPR